MISFLFLLNKKLFAFLGLYKKRIKFTNNHKIEPGKIQAKPHSIIHRNNSISCTRYKKTWK